jgi:hypothetical protein
MSYSDRESHLPVHMDTSDSQALRLQLPFSPDLLNSPYQLSSPPQSAPKIQSQSLPFRQSTPPSIVVALAVLHLAHRRNHPLQFGAAITYPFPCLVGALVWRGAETCRSACSRRGGPVRGVGGDVLGRLLECWEGESEKLGGAVLGAL